MRPQKKGSDVVYTLLLRLSGPLQSWGSDSLYDDRETDYFPTKSGVTGMLAAALGLQRGDSLEELNCLKFGVRVDFQGTYLNDYQITNMGEKWKLNVSHRGYLSDALFLAGVCTHDLQVLEKLEAALKHPKFVLYLGRKSCPPTQPVFLKIVEKELYQALLEEEWLIPNWRKRELFGKNQTINLEIFVESDRGMLKKDVPLSFVSCKREYGYRYVEEKSPKVLCCNTQEVETSHDPMVELE